MPEFEVTLPIAGVAYLTVDAETAEEAIEKAMEEVSQEHLEEWEAYRHLCQGNVLYVRVNDAEAVQVS